MVGTSTARARGLAGGELTIGPSNLRLRGSARGTADCMPHGGEPCGQLVVDLELRVALSDPADLGRVGSLRMEWLGSLLRQGETGQWVAVDSAGTLKSDEELLQRLLDTMDDGESCGV